MRSARALCVAAWGLLGRPGRASVRWIFILLNPWVQELQWYALTRVALVPLAALGSPLHVDVLPMYGRALPPDPQSFDRQLLYALRQDLCRLSGHAAGGGWLLSSWCCFTCALAASAPTPPAAVPGRTPRLGDAPAYICLRLTLQLVSDYEI